MFQSSSPFLEKSQPPIWVNDTIITATQRLHPTRKHNDPIARAALYQLSYTPKKEVSIKASAKMIGTSLSTPIPPVNPISLFLTLPIGDLRSA